MGAFEGRIARDRLVEQAGYLARGDTDGFEAKFGKLGRIIRSPSLSRGGFQPPRRFLTTSLASNLSILRPSMSTISNCQPPKLKRSPTSGICLSTDKAKPAAVA